jgi:hypothetical protein
MGRGLIPSPADEPGKWLALAMALIALGVLPKRWEKAVGVTAALVYFLK